MPVSKLEAVVGLLLSSPGTQAGRGEELPPAETLLIHYVGMGVLPCFSEGQVILE